MTKIKENINKNLMQTLMAVVPLGASAYFAQSLIKVSNFNGNPIILELAAVAVVAAVGFFMVCEAMRRDHRIKG